MSGQASAEFMITLSVFLSIALAMFIIYSSAGSTNLEHAKYLKAKRTADMLASRVNGLLVHGGETSGTHAVLDRSDYNITVSGKEIAVEFGGQHAYSHIHSGDIVLAYTGTELIVRKDGKVIYIEDA